MYIGIAIPWRSCCGWMSSHEVGQRNPHQWSKMAGTGELDTLAVVVWEQRHSGLPLSCGKWCSHGSACGQTASPVSPSKCFLNPVVHHMPVGIHDNKFGQMVILVQQNWSLSGRRRLEFIMPRHLHTPDLSRVRPSPRGKSCVILKLGLDFLYPKKPCLL